MERLRDFIDPKYVRNIDFSKPYMTPEEKKYIASLSEKKKEILKKKAAEVREKIAKDIQEFKEPKQIKVVTGEELEKAKEKARNKGEFEKMLRLIEDKDKDKEKKIELPEIETDYDFDILKDYFENFQFQDGGSLISDRNMKILIRKLSLRDVKGLCTLDKNLKKWCVHNKKWVVKHYKKRNRL